MLDYFSCLNSVCDHGEQAECYGVVHLLVTFSLSCSLVECCDSNRGVKNELQHLYSYVEHLVYTRPKVYT